MTEFEIARFIFDVLVRSDQILLFQTTLTFVLFVRKTVISLRFPEMSGH